MPVLQPVYRTGPRQRSIARNLIASASQPASHIVAATEENDTYAAHVTVVTCKSQKIQIKCGVALVVGQRYYMVRSGKFLSRWYVITRNVRTGVWMCSSREAQVQRYCISQVEMFRSTKKAA